MYILDYFILCIKSDIGMETCKSKQNISLLENYYTTMNICKQVF